MRISRNTSHQFTRRSRRGSGCLPFFILVSVAVAVVALGRNWIGQWINLNHPPDTQISLQNAQSAFENGDLTTSIDYASQLLTENSTQEQVIFLLVRSLIYQSYSDYDGLVQRQSALDISAQGLVNFPRSLDIQAIHAYALQANNRADEAGRIALRVIDKSPEHIMARIVLSMSYRSQGIFEASLREANVAVELANQYQHHQMESYRTLAIAYSNLGQYENALLSIQRAIEFNHKLIPLHFERALYAIQLGNTDQASVSYFQILAFDDDNAKVRFRLCELSGSLQERDVAIRYCKEVTELAPNWSDGWYQLGHEYFLQGDLSKAKTAFNQCTTLQVKQDVPIPDRRFECWYLQGQSAEIIGDCHALLTIYNEFLDMAERTDIPQTWTYPPEGPPACADIPPTVTASYTPP
jgi:tetratricopeptide (TPR) repeat protein